MTGDVDWAFKPAITLANTRPKPTGCIEAVANDSAALLKTACAMSFSPWKDG